MTTSTEAPAAAVPTARARRVREQPAAFAAWLGVSLWTLAAFGVCSVLALVAIWAHRYPAGIDLPQHAHLFRLWTDLRDAPPIEYRDLYRVELFTPYLVPYSLAYPLTLAFGPLAAVKCLLSISAVFTPLLLARWFKTVGSEPAFGLVGFVVAFDYGYLWGFVSYTTAIPLLVAYFTAVDSQGDRPSLLRILGVGLLGIGVFFSHGIIFGYAVIVVGLRLVLDGRWLARWRRGLHLVPMGTMALIWLVVRQKQTSEYPIREWFDVNRAVSLFSSAFMPTADREWALVAMGGVLLFLLFARPRLSFSVARVVPAAVALLAFVALPDWLASTWLVGTRFAVFVHAFAPALLGPGGDDPISKRWRGALFALVASFLLLTNQRLSEFNRELAGLNKLMAKIPRGADVETVVVASELDSRVMGSQQLGQTPAWVTAQRGGMIANDSGQYFQIPIQHNPVPFPQDYRFAIGHGDAARYGHSLRALTGASGPPTVADKWLLFERPRIKTPDYTVVRWGQSFAKLRQNLTSGGDPLRIAGQTYARGLGAHAHSFIRLRFARDARRFEGACGVDDGSSGRGQVRFRIRDDDGKVLFDSKTLKSGQAAKPFSIELGGRSELLLEALPVQGINFAHADWVDLTLR